MLKAVLEGGRRRPALLAEPQGDPSGIPGAIGGLAGGPMVFAIIVGHTLRDNHSPRAQGFTGAAIGVFCINSQGVGPTRRRREPQ